MYKNVYVYLSKKKKEYICSLPFLSSFSLLLPGAVCVRVFHAVPSPHVVHSSSSESCHLVPTSLLGPLPSLSLCLHFFLA